MMKSITVSLLTLAIVYFMVSVFFAGLEFNPIEWIGTAKVMGSIGVVISVCFGVMNHIEENN